MTKCCLLAALAFYLLPLTQEYPGFLLFGEYNNLWQVALHDNATVGATLKIPITKNISSAVALDYNFLDEKVYWADERLKRISRAFLNGTSQETIVQSRLSYLSGLAVDCFGENVYWTERYEDVIEVASLDGMYRRVLIRDELQNPRDIVLDVTRGFMYWTHSFHRGQKPKIERADMDGSNRRIAIQLGCSGDSYPSSLALDVTKNWLYWVDSYHDKLEVYEFPSKTRREIIRSHGEAFLRNPTGLALLGNHLFWTDSYWNGIFRADRETGDNAAKIVSTQYDPMTIQAYDKNLTVTPVTDQCNSNNGGCSQLCLLTPFGRKCSCSAKFILSDDGKTCLDPPQFLLFADATNRRIMKVFPQDSGSLTSVSLSNTLSRPVALAYDFVEDRVYWTDVWRNTISRSFLNGSSQEVIIDKRLNYPYGLAVDVIGRNLYWTDNNRLEISKLNGTYRTALISTDLYQPKDIILDVNKGIMYWTNRKTSPKIEKADMTGKMRVVLVSSGLQQPNGLTLDHNKNRLYWVDSSYHTLEYLDLDQNNRVTLIRSYSALPSPFGLTLLGDNLYWTDTQERAVYRASKGAGGNVTKFVTSDGQPMDIHGYNLSEYSRQGNSSCQLNNGGCSHLCLLSSTENATATRHCLLGNYCH
ncbi:low-density lipoprotein receptor-related protein 4-like [Oculina patagonica]